LSAYVRGNCLRQVEGSAGGSCCEISVATFAAHAAQHWRQQLALHSLQVMQMLLKDDTLLAGVSIAGQPLALSVLLAWDALQWVRCSK